MKLKIRRSKNHSHSRFKRKHFLLLFRSRILQMLISPRENQGVRVDHKKRIRGNILQIGRHLQVKVKIKLRGKLKMNIHQVENHEIKNLDPINQNPRDPMPQTPRTTSHVETNVKRAKRTPHRVKKTASIVPKLKNQSMSLMQNSTLNQ